MKIKLRILQQLGMKSLAQNKYDKAEQYFRQVYNKVPKMQGSRFNLAVALMGLKRFEEAESLLNDDIAQFGEDFNRVRAVADLYYLAGKAEEARDSYAKLLEYTDTPQEERLFSERISLCSSPENFQQVVKGNEAFDEGNQLISQNKYEEAVAAFKRAAKHDHTNFNAWNNIGTICFVKLDDPDQALEAYRQAAQYTSMESVTESIEAVKKALENKKK